MLAMMQPALFTDDIFADAARHHDKFLLNALSLGGPSSARLSTESPHVDESEMEVIVTFIAPGVKAADIELIFQPVDNRLIISGESKSRTHTSFLHHTTSLGKLILDVSKATAAVEDGVVTVTLPKKVREEVKLPVRTHIVVSANPSDDEPSDEENYNLTLSAPGFAPSDISVEQHGGLLKVSGESKRTKRKIDSVYRLPRDADATGRATASQVDGILTVTIPKAPEPEPIRIPVARKIPETPAAAAALAPAEGEATAAPAADANEEFDGVMV